MTDNDKNATSDKQDVQADSRELTQEELAARYLEQQRRMRCPSCGEQEEYF